MHSTRIPSLRVRRSETRYSRRQFLQVVAGTAGVLVTGYLWPSAAPAAGRDPKPIPGGFAYPTGGPFVHANVAGPADAPPNRGNEPSTITNFDGIIGVAHIQGTGTGTNTDNGDTFPLLFDADIRFMKGVYQRVDGRFGEATFGLVWLDLYQGQFDFDHFTTQVHDFNPGFLPNDVVWTVRLEDDSVQVDFENGQAVLNADIDLLDYTNIPNGLALGPAVPSAVTLELIWSGPIRRDITVRDTDNSFSGRFLENMARIAWSASRAGFKFVSDAVETSTSVFAELGRERNGLFS